MPRSDLLADDAPPHDSTSGQTRRAFLGHLGVVAAAAGGAGAALAQQDETAAADEQAGDLADGLSVDTVSRAEELIGLELTDAERALMLEDLEELRASYGRLRSVHVPNDVPPALVFRPVADGPRAAAASSRAAGDPWRPDGVTEWPDDDELPFLPVTRLASLLRGGGLTSVELTRQVLERLSTWDPLLHCVVERLEERALEEAARADAALAAGRDLGPLHGIPWGAKDLLATANGHTTWGAEPYRAQSFDHDAESVRRLGAAGAVLTAKLTLGALAWGDVWFGGKTRNPWNTEQGSSGSSAGSASAVAAGLVPFALGSETLGSIVSPCTRCGTSGLRPTFGLVGRGGAMALSWSMDKLGPIARSVDDCALVLEALAGGASDDPATQVADRGPGAFRWRPDLDPTTLRVGVVRQAFEEERDDTEWRAFDLAVLQVLEGLGLDLIDIRLPTEGDDALPVDALASILTVEAAAAFDELTRSGRDDLLVRQERNAWPNVFRQARFVPAVEYVQAHRVRTLLGRQMADLMSTVDVYVCPSYGAGSLLTTNLTGHPAVVVPNGFREDGTPTSITFTGRLFGENELLAVARAYQRATDFHLRRPKLALPAED